MLTKPEILILKYEKMKTYYKILLSLTAFAMLFLSSCLNDSDVGIETPDFKGTPYLVDFNEMPNSEGLLFRSMIQKLNNTDTEPFMVRVNLSSPNTLSKDLTVTLALDEQFVNDYIADALNDGDPNTNGFELIDPSIYNVPSYTVTIPAGQREAEFTVNVATGNITLQDSLLVAFSIVDVSDGAEISGNFGTALIKIGVKNFFEGDYDARVIYRHPSSGTYPDNINVDRVYRKKLSTTSANTCQTSFAVWSNACWITINPDNSIEYIVSPTWAYDVLPGDPYDASKVSSYDPATKTIYLYYHYFGSGGPRIFDETFTFVQ